MRRLVICDGTSVIPPAVLRGLAGWTVYAQAGIREAARARHALVVLDTVRAATSSPVELHMIPAFDPAGTRLPHRGVIDAIERAAKGDAVVNLSWGVNMKGAGLFARSRMLGEIADWRALQARNPGVMLVWAAGNTGDLLPDDDVEYPQAALQSDTSACVGGLLGGKPAAFSADAGVAPVLAMDASWYYEGASYTGTSFAAPKAAAVFLEQGWRKCSDALRYARPVPGGERKGLFTLNHVYEALRARRLT